MTWMRRLFDHRNYKFSSDWITTWNSHVDEIMENDTVIDFVYFLLTDGRVKQNKLKKLPHFPGNRIVSANP